jgi:hypothetical protein
MLHTNTRERAGIPSMSALRPASVFISQPCYTRIYSHEANHPTAQALPTHGRSSWWYLVVSPPTASNAMVALRAFASFEKSLRNELSLMLSTCCAPCTHTK